MTFTRRFSAVPSVAVLLAVSGVVIVDSPPQVPAQAAPFGKIAVVGEFEDGPFNTPTDLLTGADQPTIFGGLGFTYGSQKYQYACAKQSGGTEPWNGNGWVQTSKLPFRALCFVRVDTSVGSVTLTPRAYVQGTIKAPFNLTASGLTFIFNPNGTGNVTATFTAAAGTHTGAAGTFNSFTGGEILTLTVDDGSATQVVFQPGDTTIAAILARINLVMGATIATNSGGQIKLTSLRLGTGSKVIIAASAVATTLGLTAGTYSGSGDAFDLSQLTYAEFKAKVDAASALVVVTQSSSGFPRVVSKLGGTGTVAIGAGTANAALGFATTATAATAALPAAVSIPAGTRCSDGTTVVVTMQTTAVAAASTGSTNLKVRPAVDDGTYAGATGGTVTTLTDKPGDYEWSVTNGSALTAALTAAQLDSAYLTAIASTIGVGNATTRRISGIVSARQSNAIRAAIKQNAVDASANGHFDRRAFICPSNATTAAAAIASTAPGVGAYRAEECSYVCGPVAAFLQELIDGGYSTTGKLERHPDTYAAARWSVLTPGYNPGQIPEDAQYRFDATLHYGLGAVAAAWTIDTYAAFKVAGVMATEFNEGYGIGFEQGVTSVDPAADPTRVDVSRRTLAGFVGDSLTALLFPQSKRQGTERRREANVDAIEGFLDQLVGDTVDSYKVTVGNGPANHIVQYLVAIDPVQSDDVALVNLKVGPKAVELIK